MTTRPRPYSESGADFTPAHLVQTPRSQSAVMAGVISYRSTSTYCPLASHGCGSIPPTSNWFPATSRMRGRPCCSPTTAPDARSKSTVEYPSSSGSAETSPPGRRKRASWTSPRSSFTRTTATGNRDDTAPSGMGPVVTRSPLTSKSAGSYPGTRRRQETPPAADAALISPVCCAHTTSSRVSLHMIAPWAAILLYRRSRLGAGPTEPTTPRSG